MPNPNRCLAAERERKKSILRETVELTEKDAEARRSEWKRTQEGMVRVTRFRIGAKSNSRRGYQKPQYNYRVMQYEPVTDSWKQYS